MRRLIPPFAILFLAEGIQKIIYDWTDPYDTFLSVGTIIVSLIVLKAFWYSELDHIDSGESMTLRLWIAFLIGLMVLTILLAPPSHPLGWSGLKEYRALIP